MFEAVLVPGSEYLRVPKQDMLARLKTLDFAFKPVFMSLGDVFEEDPDMGRIRNFFNDFFHANDKQSLVSLNSLFKVVIVLVGISKDRFQLIVHTGQPATNGKRPERV